VGTITTNTYDGGQLMSTTVTDGQGNPISSVRKNREKSGTFRDSGGPRFVGGSPPRNLLAGEALADNNRCMPRTSRASVGGYCYHALNRGNGRAQVFHDGDDYDRFVRLLRQACARVPMRLVGYCLMPNHFHLVLWPRGDNDLSTWIQWLLTAHVHGYRKRYRGSGHVWQGRFKAFPIEEGEHLLAVLRCAERNPLRANLVVRAEDWAWSSLPEWLRPPLLPWLDPGPVPRPSGWLELVQAAQTEAELAALRRSVARNAPYGSRDWVEETAVQLGLESSLRASGRPRNHGFGEQEEGDLFLNEKP
jgi:putative transposase